MLVQPGLSLRLEYIDEFLSETHPVKCFEIIADNWLSEGPHHKKLEQIAAKSKLYFHCVGMNVGGTDPLNISYLNKIKDLNNKFKPIHISDHLCFQKHNNKNHHDLLPFAYNQNNLKRISERISKIQDHFKAPIGLENLSSYIEFEQSDITEVEFLNELCHINGCFQLLDLNNIWVNEQNLNIKAQDYLSAVDFRYVKEVHLAGANHNDELIIDDHGAPINNEVMNLFKQILPQLNKDTPVFYERDAHLPEFNELIDEYTKLSEVIAYD